MNTASAMRELIRARLAAERGAPPIAEAPVRLALCYPSPYPVGMASLGFLAMHRLLNAAPGVACRRAFLPDAAVAGAPLWTYEDGRPAAESHALCFSVAYDLELMGVISCLEAAGLRPLRSERDPARDPVVIAGGPLTFSNPLPLAPLVDVIVMGEGEATAAEWLAALRDDPRPQAVRAALRGRPHFLVPDDDERVPAIPSLGQCDDALLPAASTITTPESALSDMALIEAARGCSRGCTFCVMGRWTNGGMRLARPEAILAAVPPHARRVGLVGAAVSDHPRIADVVEALVERGLEVGLSSLRADRLDERFVRALARGGYRTLTVAADAPSEALRYRMEKRIKERHLLKAAELAARHGIAKLKIYTIVGLPGETDADLDELAGFLGELARVLPVAVTASVFVPKHNTPMLSAPFCGVRDAKRRIAHLRRAIGRLRGGGRRNVDLRAVSPREAWLEFRFSQGGPATGLAAVRAHAAGGGHHAIAQALDEVPGCAPLWSRDDTPVEAWAYQPGSARRATSPG